MAASLQLIGHAEYLHTLTFNQNERKWLPKKIHTWYEGKKKERY